MAKRDSVSIELVGFTVIRMEAGAILHQREVAEPRGWFIFPVGTYGFDHLVKPLTDEEIAAGKYWRYGSFDRLYRLEETVHEITFSFVGNSNAEVRGGIDAEHIGSGVEVFADWEKQIVAIADEKLSARPKPSANAIERFPTVSFITIWEYNSGVYTSYSEPDDYWSEWRLIGAVAQSEIIALAQRIEAAKNDVGQS